MKEPKLTAYPVYLMVQLNQILEELAELTIDCDNRDFGYEKVKLARASIEVSDAVRHYSARKPGTTESIE